MNLTFQNQNSQGWLKNLLTRLLRSGCVHKEKEIFFFEKDTERFLSLSLFENRYYFCQSSNAGDGNWEHKSGVRVEKRLNIHFSKGKQFQLTHLNLDENLKEVVVSKNSERFGDLKIGNKNLVEHFKSFDPKFAF